MRDERTAKHVSAIREACDLLRSVMHQADGSTDPGPMQEHVWTNQNMVHAAIYIDIAEMFAEKGARS